MTPRKPRRAAGLGVTDDDYARMLAAQDGHCALCPSTPKTRRFSVDHDHATGRVRGLLCHRCNRALPTWITTAWLLRAVAYLANTDDDYYVRLGISMSALADAGGKVTLGPSSRTATPPQQATTGRGFAAR